MSYWKNFMQKKEQYESKQEELLSYPGLTCNLSNKHTFSVPLPPYFPPIALVDIVSVPLECVKLIYTHIHRRIHVSLVEINSGNSSYLVCGRKWVLLILKLPRWLLPRPGFLIINSVSEMEFWEPCPLVPWISRHALSADIPAAIGPSHPEHLIV